MDNFLKEDRRGGFHDLKQEAIQSLRRIDDGLREIDTKLAAVEAEIRDLLTETESSYERVIRQGRGS